jgi:hypothetical protein
MIETKFFEVRDHGTFIPIISTRYVVDPNNSIAYSLFRHGGWSNDNPPIVVTHLSSSKANVNPFDWTNGRTMSIAHQHIIRDWDQLNSGQVIDVRVVLGETNIPVENEL